MIVAQFTKPVTGREKGAGRDSSTYRAARRLAGKARYRDAKRGLLPKPVMAVRSRPIRQNTKFNRWF